MINTPNVQPILLQEGYDCGEEPDEADLESNQDLSNSEEESNDSDSDEDETSPSKHVHEESKDKEMRKLDSEEKQN